MKIAYLFADRNSPVLGCEGSSAHITEMCRALVNLGNEVFVIAGRKGEKSDPHFPIEIHELMSAIPGYSQLRVCTAPVSTAHVAGRAMGSQVRTSWSAPAVLGDVGRELGGRALDSVLYKRAAKIIAEEKPDALYERYVPGSTVGMRLAKHFQLPRVMEMNASFTFPEEWWHLHSPLFPILVKRQERQVTAGVNKIVVVSSRMKDYLVRLGLAPPKVIVLPNAADPEAFEVEFGEPEAVRAHYRIQEGTVVVGFVGSLRPFHDLDSIITSAKAVMAKTDKICFLIVGEGPLRSALNARVAKEGLSDFFIFTGRVTRSRVPSMLAAMDIVLATSPPMQQFHYSPLKVFEYMAAGKPMIVSRCGDIEQVITTNIEGILVEPGDSAALEEALLRLISDTALRERLGNSAKQKLQAKFTWKHNATTILNLFRESVHELKADRSAAAAQGCQRDRL